MTKIVGRLFVASLLVGAASHSAAADKPVDMKLTDAAGATVHLRDLRGKLVVLNFWATWCGPCREEMPMLAAADKQYRGRGVVFVGASLDDDKSKRLIGDYLKRFGVEYTVWSGATGDDLDKLHMGEAVPATAFLDTDGHIAGRISGQIREGEIQERLDWLLSDRKGPAPSALVKHLEGH